MMGRDVVGQGTATSVAVTTAVTQNKGSLLAISGVVDVRHGGNHVVVVCSSITPALKTAVAAQMVGKGDYSIVLNTTTE